MVFLNLVQFDQSNSENKAGQTRSSKINKLAMEIKYLGNSDHLAA